MAKRYHNGMGPGFYSSYEQTKAQETRDGGMIRADHKAVANMPQSVIYKEWPSPRGYMPENLNDTISGINKQIGSDHGKTMKHFQPKQIG